MVFWAEELKYPFSHDFAQRLHGIERIEILNCSHLVDIFLVEEELNLVHERKGDSHKECHRLQHLFSFSSLQRFMRLETIRIVDCEEIGSIFNAATDDELHNPGLQSGPLLPYLRILLLAYLPMLTSFIDGSTTLNFLSSSCLEV